MNSDQIKDLHIEDQSKHKAVGDGLCQSQEVELKDIEHDGGDGQLQSQRVESKETEYDVVL